MLPTPLHDGESLLVPANGTMWQVTWHPPTRPPTGTAHGASAWCVTANGEVVLISNDERRWDWPGGRPEAGEDWEATMRRELREECCAEVGTARLLGFARAAGMSGPQVGVVLVRSIWRAAVTLHPWEPAFEIAHRCTVPPAALASTLPLAEGWGPLYARALQEAGLG